MCLRIAYDRYYSHNTHNDEIVGDPELRTKFAFRHRSTFLFRDL
jgi:hypothetical protein